MNRYKFIDEGMKHLHTLDGKALIGGSTAKSIVGKGDNLMQWYADMAAVAGLAMPQQDIRAEYEAAQALTDKIARAKAKKELDAKYPDYAEARRAAVKSRDKSAGTGTERHGLLETYIKCVMAEKDGKPYVCPDLQEIKMFMEWSVANVNRFYFTEAHCYSEELWVGGIADLGLEMKDGKRFVGDHKNSKEAYPDQFLQCAIYDLLLESSGGLDKDGNKLFDWKLADGYIIFPFRSEPFTPEFRFNAEEYRQGARNVIQLYKLLEVN